MSAIIAKPQLDKALLPVYQRWKANKTAPNGLWNYLRQTSNHEVAAAYSKLFWPDFIEVEGCILLAETTIYPRVGTEEFKLRAMEDPRGVEFTGNYTYVPHLLRGEVTEPVDSEWSNDEVREVYFSSELFVYLAQILLVCWRHALQETFPTKKFDFFYQVEEGGYGAKLSFWQIVEPDHNSPH